MIMTAYLVLFACGISVETLCDRCFCPRKSLLEGVQRVVRFPRVLDERFQARQTSSVAFSTNLQHQSSALYHRYRNRGQKSQAATWKEGEPATELEVLPGGCIGVTARWLHPSYDKHTVYRCTILMTSRAFMRPQSELKAHSIRCGQAVSLAGCMVTWPENRSSLNPRRAQTDGTRPD